MRASPPRAIVICDMRSGLPHVISICDVRSGPPHAIAIKPPNIVLHVYLHDSTLNCVQCSECINQHNSWSALHMNKPDSNFLHISTHNVNTSTYKSKIIFWHTKISHFLRYMIFWSFETYFKNEPQHLSPPGDSTFFHESAKNWKLMPYPLGME